MESCAYWDVQIEIRLVVVDEERSERGQTYSKFEEERKSEYSPGRTIAKHSGGKSTCSSP